MVSGLKLGDFVLDPRRVLYVPSLKAVVCAGLHEALSIGIAAGLRGVLERLDSVLQEYKPESLIVLGGFNEQSAIIGIARRWGKLARVHFVANDINADARTMAEALDCEVHCELIWGRYRFVEQDKDGALEVHLTTIAGAPHYCVKIGSLPFGGMRLAVFAKGLGRLILPTMNPNGSASSVFSKQMERFDVFAVGHQRVLPMGKVADLKSVRGLARGLPIAKATLGVKKRVPKEPLAD